MAEPRRGAPAPEIEPYRPPGLSGAAIAGAAARALAEPAVGAYGALSRIGEAIASPVYNGIAAIGREISGEMPPSQPASQPAQQGTEIAPPAAGVTGAQAVPAIGPDPMALVRTGKTTQTISSALDPRVAASLIGEGRTLDALQRAGIEDATQRRSALAEQTAGIQERLRKEQDALRDRLGGRASVVAKRLDLLDRQLSEHQSAAAADEYVPLGSMTRTGRAVTAIAAVLEGISAASQRRPSRGAAIIQAAIDSDLQTYRARVEQRMRQIGWTRDQIKSAMERYGSIEAGMRQAMERSAQLEMASIATRAQDVGARLDAANTAIEIGRKSLSRTAELSAQARGRSTTTTTSEPAAIADAKSAKTLETPAMGLARKAVTGAVDVLAEARRLRQMWMELRPGAVSGRIPGTDSERYRRAASAFQGTLAKLRTTGSISDREQKMLAGTVPLGIFPGGESLESGLKKFDLIEQASGDKLAGAVISAPGIAREIPGAYSSLVASRVQALSRPQGAVPGARSY